MQEFVDDGELLPRKSDDVKHFVPTLAKPLPQFRCVVIKKDGERCTENGYMGMTPENSKCHHHGGKVPNIQEAARERCDAARLQLTDNVELAVETLKALMGEQTGEATRLRAATEVLDRTIGKAPLEINVNEEITVNSASDEVRRKLAKLFDPSAEEDEDEDIIDAVVEEEDAE